MMFLMIIENYFIGIILTGSILSGILELIDITRSGWDEMIGWQI